MSLVAMSHQYADLLSSYDNKGVLGALEYQDAQDEIETKAKMIAQLIKDSKCCMIYTGAGISTSAKISDFRGRFKLSYQKNKNIQQTF
jgi:hypothetical protein